MAVKKFLAAVGALTMLAGTAVLGIGLASPAQAAGQSITVTPNKDLKDGDVVSVTAKGFTGGAPVAIGLCRNTGTIKGSGDCGRTKDGAAKLTVADASGTATAQITIVKGALGNTTKPDITCPPCRMGAANISDATQSAYIELNYASATDKKKAAPETNAAPKTKAPKEALPKTGPRETMMLALAGFVVFQIGLVLAVRATRAAPRRTAL